MPLRQARVLLPGPGYTAHALTTFLPLSESEHAELGLHIEFDNEWEATRDLNEDDVETVMEERVLYCPHLMRRGGRGRTGSRSRPGRGRGKCREGGEEPIDLS